MFSFGEQRLEIIAPRDIEEILSAITDHFGIEHLVNVLKYANIGVYEKEYRAWWQARIDEPRINVDETKQVDNKNALLGITLQAEGESALTGYKYSDEVLLDAVSIYNSRLGAGTSFGEINVASRLEGLVGDDYNREYIIIDESRVVVKIQNAHFKPGVGIIGDAFILDSPMGLKLKSVMQHGHVPIFGMRAQVEVEPTDLFKVKKCTIISFDVVNTKPGQPPTE